MVVAKAEGDYTVAQQSAQGQNPVNDVICFLARSIRSVLEKYLLGDLQFCLRTFTAKGLKNFKVLRFRFARRTSTILFPRMARFMQEHAVLKFAT